MEIKINKMTSDDIERCLLIENQVFRKRWDSKVFVQELETGYYLIASSESDIIGFTGMQKVLDEAHITTVAVEPKYQGIGVGTMLVEHLLADAKKAGIKNYYLEVRRSNAAAQSLYKKFGFDVLVDRKNYYSNPADDALVMRRQNASDSV